MTRWMKANTGTISASYHFKRHRETDGCFAGSPCIPEEPAVDTVTVAVPKIGVHVVENGKLLDTAQHHIMTRTVGNVWHFELEAKRELPFFEAGKKYKRDGVDRWFKVLYVDKHPQTGVYTAHGWFEDEREFAWPGTVVAGDRDDWQGV